ncbi:MAG: ATP-dependent protease LonB [Candidatus Heimdallarchaeota archaeon]|nr:ATP-dependent protease LonB [Candidatus Heimdallarchaeota archaeon]MDH5645247.1 ATP-dependent protease LonB [Candidatus Heimdallarchaeota archaeon]
MTDIPTDELINEESLLDIDFEHTGEISIPSRIIDQVIGQEDAVNVMQKAAAQRRHVMLIGEPGTGKSLLGAAMAEMLPKKHLEDILVVANPENFNNPRIVSLPGGEGRIRVELATEQAKKSESTRSMFAIIILLTIIILGTIMSGFRIEVILLSIFVGLFAFMMLNSIKSRSEVLVPKLLVDNSTNDTAPFIDGTGSHSGALLGDVRHDPFQSGGLGTPAHERVEVGLIHKAHKGVLYIDEIGTFHVKTQQQLLTALQEKKFQITGQSELSSGAMVRTDPVPCDFILIAAGNEETIRNLHPALRSRIRGQGYEVVMKLNMPDTMANRRKLTRFVAQEVAKDHKIPHFTKKAVETIILEAKRRSSRKNSLSLLLRELGGLVRVAGDLAIERKLQYVTPQEVMDARKISTTLEFQLSRQHIARMKDYDLVLINDYQVGRVNGLSVIGNSAGSVMPIEAEITPTHREGGGKIIATGQLRVIARESVQNVSALIKNYMGKDISNMDIHIQFVGTYGVEGDSASITIASAVLSAIENIPLRQDTAMTGSLSVRGNVLPIGGATYKTEAAIRTGIKRVIVPWQNMDDLNIDKDLIDKIEIIPVKTFVDVLRNIVAPEYLSIVAKFEDQSSRTNLDIVKKTQPSFSPSKGSPSV